MIKIGLTGGLGTGKTTALKFFKKCGAVIADMDQWVHEELKDDRSLKVRLRRVFGEGIFVRGAVSRRLLARRVFSHKKELLRLNAFIHPLMRQRLSGFFKKNRGAGVVVVEVPLLFESGFDKYFDVSVGVKAGLKARRARCQGRYRLSDWRQRLKAQLPLKRKIARCDFIIDNDGKRQETFQRVQQIMEEIKWKS